MGRPHQLHQVSKLKLETGVHIGGREEGTSPLRKIDPPLNSTILQLKGYRAVQNTFPKVCQNIGTVTGTFPGRWEATDGFPLFLYEALGNHIVIVAVGIAPPDCTVRHPL